jgi:3-oxoacyl-[acyl-carrier protein] reductase
MREHGPVEYGEGTTLTAVAEAVAAAAHGVRTIRALGDLTDGADIARVVEAMTKELGPIDILVHNAGGDIAAKGGKPDPNDAVGIREGRRARGARPQPALNHPDLPGGGRRK